VIGVNVDQYSMENMGFGDGQGKWCCLGSLGTSVWITWRFCWQNEWDMTGGSSQFLAKLHS